MSNGKTKSIWVIFKMDMATCGINTTAHTTCNSDVELLFCVNSQLHYTNKKVIVIFAIVPVPD